MSLTPLRSKLPNLLRGQHRLQRYGIGPRRFKRSGAGWPSGNLCHPQLKPKSLGGVGSTTELGVQREEARPREEDCDEADEVEEGHLPAVRSAQLAAVD